MRVILSFILAFCITFIVSSCIDSEEQSRKFNIYHQEATVVTIGQCDANSCGVGVKSSNSGEVEYIKIGEPVSLNQTVYRMCWTEKKRGNMCYLKYSTQKETS